MPQTNTAAAESKPASEEGRTVLPAESMPSIWPVVIGPMVVIGVAALGGYLADVAGYHSGELATLAIGTATAAVLVGVVVFRIQPTKRSWLTAVSVTVVGLALLGLGMVKLRDVGSDTTSAASAPPSAASSASSAQVLAGHHFSQEDIGTMRDFRGADLRGAQFMRLDLRGIDFSGANAAGASFDGSRLDRAVFRGADLGGAVLSRTCLNYTVLRGADLVGVVATDADVSNAEVGDEKRAATEWPQPSTQSTACR